jgi:dTDP-4-dehydrorhamnose reductase
MKRVLVLGSTGMLGHQVVIRLNQNPGVEVYDLSFRTKLRDETIICDVTDFEKLTQIIEQIHPDVIINCIGILIRGSNENPKNSILINAYLPHYLASQADEIGAKLIHVSTDCVFSGKKGRYVESDYRDADDVYGRGKALGEVFSDKHLTLRTSIIGPELKKKGEGLFHWFMSQSGTIKGFTKAIWGGVTTVELAKVIEFSIVHQVSGLYHVTNEIPISKHDLLELFKSEFEKDIKIEAFDGKQVDKSLITEYPKILPKIPDYSQMIHEIKLFMDSHEELYSSIYLNAQ